MTQLKLQSKQVKLVSDDDLARFIAEAYGIKEYEYIAAEELNNDSYKMYLVEKAELDAYDRAKLEKFRKTGFEPYVTRVLLNDLCNKGWLEPGDYLIHIRW